MFKHLLVPVDGSALAEAAIDTAIVLAQAAGAEIALITAHEARRPGLLDATVDYTADPEQRSYVRKLAERIATHSHVRSNGCVEIGDPAEVILRRARELGCDLIVMTTNGRTGLRRTLLGSVAHEVVRTSRLPVLMLRPAGDSITNGAAARLFHRVLVPLDGTRVSAAVLPFATALARCGGGGVLLMRVIQPLPLFAATGDMPIYSPTLLDPAITTQLAADARHELDAMASSVSREYAVSARSVVTVADSAADSILATAEAESADAIAMTPQSHGASRLVLGSVCDRVLRHGSLPLLLYRPSDGG